MKLLIIAPAFPPDKSVGVVRISSFVSYLKEQGHFITVLTQRKDNYEVGLCDEYVTVDQDKNYNCGIISRYKQFVANGNKYQEKCIEILNKYKFDLVLITGGPFFTFKLSRQIYLRKTPCALDFRDPWVGDVRGMKDLLSPKRIISRMLFFPMEIKAIHYADLVTTVTPGWVKMLKQMHPFEKDKIELVKNGYDEKKMPRLYDTKKYNTLDIQIGVFGKLFYYSTYYSKVFLNAIHEMSSDKKISLFQIGDKEENADGLLRECGLESEVLASTGFVDYGQGIYMLSKVDILLIIDSRKSALGTKLYDYIYIGKPIIYVGPKKSAFASEIQLLKNGYICTNSADVKRAINTICSNKSRDIRQNGNKSLYARSEQNKKWENLLKGITSIHDNARNKNCEN